MHQLSRTFDKGYEPNDNTTHWRSLSQTIALFSYVTCMAISHVSDYNEIYVGL